MQIDWLTVGAQIVNFLILVWLLQHFLYGPITRAMASREQRIAERLDEAEKKRRAAEEEARSYRQKQEELEQSRNELMQEARDAAAEARASLEQAARDEVASRKRGWLEQLTAERQSFAQDLRRRSADAFYAVARRALGDLADAELEAQIVQGFIRRLDALDEETLEKLEAGAGADDGHVVVESRFELEAGLKRQLTRAIHDRLGSNLHVDYQEAESLDVGIALVAGSQHVAWSIGHYLDDLERAVDDELARETAALKQERDAEKNTGRRDEEEEARNDAEAESEHARKGHAAR
jgi:F-type H+-transporting ATPase subunit b